MGWPSRSRRDEREAGQAVPFGLALAGVAAVLAVAMGELAADAVDAARARTAADAAALAGVRGGPAASGRLAAAHEAEVVSWAVDGRAVTVTVRVGDASATARATDEP